MRNLAFGLWLLASSGTAFGQIEVYVSDAGTPAGTPPWQILKSDADGGSPEVFIDDNLGWPQDLVFLEDAGTVLVSNLSTSRINRHDADTGEFLGVFSSSPNQPTRMKIGPDGLLYVLQWSGSGTVQRYQLDGSFVDDFTDTGVPRAIGMDWDAEGRLYVSSFSQRNVRRFSAAGVDEGLFISAGLSGPTNIAFAANGDLLVLDWTGGAVRRYDPAGNLLGNFATGLVQPEGIAILPDGNLLVGNGGAGSVREYGPDGSVAGDFIAPGAGGLVQPNAVIVRDRSAASDFEINAGLNDAWFDPATVGQGFFITVFPGIGQVSLAWYTFDAERPADPQAVIGDAGQRWFTALGPIDGNAASLSLFRTSGGVFVAAEPASTTEAVGTIELSFEDCRQGTVAYQIPGAGLSGEIPIRRVVEDNVALCEALR